MQVAFACRQPPYAFGEGCRAQFQFDSGECFPKPRHGRGQYCLHPHRAGRQPKGAATARNRPIDLLFRDLDFAEDMARQTGGDISQLRRAHALGQALEQPAAELLFQPGNHARQGWLRDGEVVGRPKNFSGIDRREKPDQVVTLLEHACAPVSENWPCAFFTIPFRHLRRTFNPLFRNSPGFSASKQAQETKQLRRAVSAGTGRLRGVNGAAGPRRLRCRASCGSSGRKGA